MNTRATWLAATCLGFLGIAFGAFGAHAFKTTLAANGRVETYELAVRYLMFQALALFAVGFLHEKYDGAGIRLAGLLHLLGVLAFSGSLFLLAVLGWRAAAYITPLGGVLMLTGWGLLAYVIATAPKKP